MARQLVKSNASAKLQVYFDFYFLHTSGFVLVPKDLQKELAD